MGKYKLTAPDGKTLQVEMDQPPTDDQATEIMSSYKDETMPAIGKAIQRGVQGTKEAFTKAQEEYKHSRDVEGTPLEKSIRGVGYDVQGAMAPVAGLTKAVATFLPDDFKEGVKKTLGQVVEPVAEAYGQLPERAREDIKGVANIGQLFGYGAAAKPALAEAEMVGKTAVGAAQAGEDVARSATAGTLEAGGNLAEKSAEKVVNVMLKPGKTGAREGFDASNAIKHGLTAPTLEGMADKTAAKLADLRKATDAVKEKAAAAGVKRNYADIEHDFLDNLLNGHGINEFDDDAVQEAAVKVLKTVRAKADASGDVDFAKMMKLRTDAGHKADQAWADARAGRSSETAPTQEVYAALNRAMSKAVKETAPDDIASIDKAYSEIIPIASAIQRRLPVSKGNEIISLSDLGAAGVGELLGHGAGAPLAVANKLLRTPLGATVLAGTGKALKSAAKKLSGIDKGE
jgi:hypothetical protein